MRRGCARFLETVHVFETQLYGPSKATVERQKAVAAAAEKASSQPGK